MRLFVCRRCAIVTHIPSPKAANEMGSEYRNTEWISINAVY
jgi:hypothetical protein